MKPVALILLFFPFFIFCGLSLQKKSEFYRESKQPISRAEEDAYTIKQYNPYQPKTYRKNYIQTQKNVLYKPQRKIKRQIIYESKVKLQVHKIKETLKNIQKITKEQQGYIETSNIKEEESYAYLKIRIPVQNFFSTLEKFFQLGRVIQHSIYAKDISKQLHDVESRLKMLKHLRKRLYELFKKAKKVKEKARILKEINRLTMEIEELESRQKYLKDKATYSTIEITLQTKKINYNSILFVSPFYWIRKLDPLKRSIYNHLTFWDQLPFFKGNFKILLEQIQKPKDFFDNQKDFIQGGEYLLYTPSGAGIRIGLVQNYPKGNINFWKTALENELKNRNYQIINTTQKNDIYFFDAKIDDGIRIYFYTIGIRLIHNEICVIEVFYPDQKEFSRYQNHTRQLFRT